MKFDLNTAFAVRERKDGLLEKDTFDLSTAVPVEDTNVGMLEKVMANPAVGKMLDVVTGGLTSEEGNQFRKEVMQPLSNIGGIIKDQGKTMSIPEAGNKLLWESGKFILSAMSRPVSAVSAGIGGAIDKKPAADIIQSMFRGYAKPEEVKSLTSRIPFQDAEQGEWYRLIPRALLEGTESYVISTLVYGNIAGRLKKAYDEAKITGAYQEIDKISTQMAKAIVKDPELQTKFKVTYPKDWTEADKIGMTKVSISQSMGQDPKIGDWASQRQTILGQLRSKLGSEKGQALIPKVGSKVDWKGQEGIITEITGQRVIIALGKSEIVATLSQLSLPKVAEATQPTEGKVVYRGTVGVGEIENIQTGKSKYIEGETGGMWTEDVKSAENYGKEMSIAQGSSTLQPKGEGNYILEGIKDNKGIITPIKATNIKTGEIIDLSGQKPPVEPPKTAVGNPEEPIKPVIKNVEISPEAQVKLESSIESIRSKLEQVKGKPLTHDEVVEAAKTSELLKDIVTRAESKEAEAALIRTEQHLAALAEETGISKDFMENLRIVSSFATNAARNLGARRIIAKPEIYTLKTKIVNKLTDLGKTIDEIEKAAQGVDFNNQEQVTAFYREFVKPNLWELINEYRYINLLSSPKTHVVNIVSNALQVGGLAPAVKLISGIIDPVASRMFGVERSHYIKEVPAYLRGVLSSVGEAGQKAFDALKGKTFVERPDVSHIPTGSKLLKPFRYIPQALEAADVFFRTMAYQGELEAQLSKGVELEKAKATATKKAAYIVFRKALDPIRIVKGKAVIPDQGALLGAIDNMTSLFYKARSLPIFGRAIAWFAPFVQTPMEIGKQMIELSPLGAGTIPGSKDKVEQLSKALLGGIITAITAGIILNQDSTAEEPTGVKEKALFRATGRIPWAIRIGDTWVSVNRLGPIGFPIAIALSTKYYLTQNPAAATDSNTQKAVKVLGGFGEYFAAQSYVESLGNLLEMVKNAPGAASKFVGNIPSQVIALSSFQRWVNSYFIDPVFRKSEKGISVESIIDNAKKSIVGATKGMEAYTDPDERPSKRSMPLINALSPVAFSKANNEYEAEYQEYLEKRREDLIEKEDQEERPSKRIRGRVR